MIRKTKPAARSKPPESKVPATIRNDSRGPTQSQCEDIRDLHALCVPAVDIVKRLRLPQALVVDEIERQRVDEHPAKRNTRQIDIVEAIRTLRGLGRPPRQIAKQLNANYEAVMFTLRHGTWPMREVPANPDLTGLQGGVS